MAKVWMHNPTTGGYAELPEEAVDSWRGLGWEPADAPPEEPNPVVAERIAWEREQAAETDAAAEAAKTKKPSSRAGTAATKEEE